ncbi:MAG: Hsp70 family protein [Myxococcales bacterium]|nr:Hsp70 family protein [Myxococcales bacterium]
MKLGIDFGTTRTLVAACDRGNYPVLEFSRPDGEACDHVPTISADLDGRLVHGHAALAAAQAGAPHLSSFKRLLGRFGAEHTVTIGAHAMSLLDLVTDFLAALKVEVLERSNLPKRMRRDATFECAVGVPANAHSGQRWTTLEAFRRAGFEVRALVHEPSAAGVEFAHRHRGVLNKKREHVAVYDLGGGTFDASLVCMSDERHDTVHASGEQELGGDDFDRALYDMVLERLGLDSSALEDLGLATSRRDRGGSLAISGREQALLAECRAAKEAIGPSTKRIVLELTSLARGPTEEPLVVPVAEYFERVRPLVERSVEKLSQVLARAGSAANSEDGDEGEDGDNGDDVAAELGVAAIYVVGGGSALPLVGRCLREKFGRRVLRSAHAAGATAMGLAILAATDTAPRIEEKFTRHFGLFREAEGGARKTFDRIFERGLDVPAPGQAPLVATRSYRAAHNIGQLRFLECGDVTDSGEPSGDVTPHAVVYVPYDASVRGAPLAELPITRLKADVGPRVEERYEVDASGVVKVTIRVPDDGFSQAFVL